MDKTIDLNKSVYDIVTEFPEITEVFTTLGFTDITKPGMLQTAGRIMTIPKGAAMKKMDLETVKAAFREKGYQIEE